MEIRKILLKHIPKNELCKLNAMSFYLKAPEESSKVIVHERDNATSTFHNSSNIVRFLFYKEPSQLIGETDE